MMALCPWQRRFSTFQESQGLCPMTKLQRLSLLPSSLQNNAKRNRNSKGTHWKVDTQLRMGHFPPCLGKGSPSLSEFRTQNRTTIMKAISKEEELQQLTALPKTSWPEAMWAIISQNIRQKVEEEGGNEDKMEIGKYKICVWQSWGKRKVDRCSAGLATAWSSMKDNNQERIAQRKPPTCPQFLQDPNPGGGC